MRTVIHYRPRSAIREVGKAMGLSEDVTAALAKTVWGSWGTSMGEANSSREAGVDLTDPLMARTIRLAEQMIGMPRHLGQHVGGFKLTEGALHDTVPIGNAAMPDRSFIEWDKDDIDEHNAGMTRAHQLLRLQRDPVPPRPAATVLLLRDGSDGIEVLMTRRSASASFAPGAYVFAGGRSTRTMRRRTASRGAARGRATST